VVGADDVEGYGVRLLRLVAGEDRAEIRRVLDHEVGADDLDAFRLEHGFQSFGTAPAVVGVLAEDRDPGRLTAGREVVAERLGEA
jgi:hypothetical protein